MTFQFCRVTTISFLDAISAAGQLDLAGHYLGGEGTYDLLLWLSIIPNVPPNLLDEWPYCLGGLFLLNIRLWAHY